MKHADTAPRPQPHATILHLVQPRTPSAADVEPVTGGLSATSGQTGWLSVFLAVSGSVWPSVFTPTPKPTPKTAENRSSRRLPGRRLWTAKDPLTGSPQGSDAYGHAA